VGGSANVSLGGQSVKLGSSSMLPTSGGPISMDSKSSSNSGNAFSDAGKKLGFAGNFGHDPFDNFGNHGNHFGHCKMHGHDGDDDDDDGHGQFGFFGFGHFPILGFPGFPGHFPPGHIKHHCPPVSP
jgi:hypothetical protein